MSRSSSFLWHDYETFGTHPALDRPAQFAAIRTDIDFNPIAEPVTWYCRPADDLLPHPDACLVTGITPQEASQKGVRECEFARLIHAEMMQAGTCSAGYNSLRFDDEFSRHLYYRNFLDPYEREWRNGNSRWDLIDLLRMCYALRPDGIRWWEREDGSPSFRLEHLTAANGIAHEDAHEALADVRATIELARLVKKTQPRLLTWALRLRRQKFAISLLDTVEPKPLVHTSSRYPASRGCTTLVLPLALMPDRPKSVIVTDLMADPAPLLESTADIISDLVFTPARDLPDGMQRIPLKAVHSNKVPMLAPAATLKGMDPQRIGLDPERCQHNTQTLLRNLPAVRSKVMEVFTRPPADGANDPDVMLYSGGFFSTRDRSLMNSILESPPDQLGRKKWRFTDRRLDAMLFRYRARNYPDLLSTEESQRWENDRKRRLLVPAIEGQLGLEQFQDELLQARRESGQNGAKQHILDQLEAWVIGLGLET